MDDKQLNFDQPLLSIRRHSLTATSEKRDDRRINSYSHQVRHHLPTYRSELKSGPIRNPGAVPFLWEQSPGQPKEEMKLQSVNSHKPPIAPRLPPGRARQQGRIDVSRIAVDAPCTIARKKQDLDASFESCVSPLNDENVENISNDTAEEKEGSDSEDSDEAFIDALDTLSRNEASFLNCSMSGLSGLQDSDVKPSGSFSRDPEACVFMIDKFLPAAKAMASNTPHAPQKQPVQQQIQKQNKTANQYKPSLRYGPSFAKRYAYYQDNQEEEDEGESDDEYDQKDLHSVCGLLPRICLKSSLCLLSPVPAMSVRTRKPSSSADRVRTGSSSSGSYSELENESRSDRSETRSTERIRKDELDENKAEMRSGSGQLESHSLPPIEVPAENMDAGIANCGLHSKGLKTFQEFLDDHESPEESSSGDPVVDTVQEVESPKLRLFQELLEEDEDVKKLHAVGEHLLPSAHKIDESAKKWRMQKPKDFNLESTCKDRTAAQAMEMAEKQTTCDNSKQKSFGVPPPPPLPKSPSDSWLWRTLPSMNTKHSSLRPILSPETNCSKAANTDMKWETIVKATKESLKTIPET